MVSRYDVSWCPNDLPLMAIQKFIAFQALTRHCTFLFHDHSVKAVREKILTRRNCLNTFVCYYVISVELLEYLTFTSFLFLLADNPKVTLRIIT